MRQLLVLAWIASTAGCLRTTEYKCMVDGDCTAMGSVCESTQYCSFIDMDCTSGRRYGDLSGPYANQCVGDQTADAGVDVASSNCPASYATLPNAGTHVYKRIDTGASWATQRDLCMADGAYLAIPDNAAELVAIVTEGAAARTWVGIDDLMTEGTYLTVKNATPTFLEFDPAENNSSQQDCVSGLMSTGKLGTDLCDNAQTRFPAVCECDP